MFIACFVGYKLATLTIGEESIFEVRLFQKNNVCLFTCIFISIGPRQDAFCPGRMHSAQAGCILPRQDAFCLGQTGRPGGSGGRPARAAGREVGRAVGRKRAQRKTGVGHRQ